MTVTAEQVARELVVEARKAGVDPVRVFEPEMVFVRAKVARRQPLAVLPVWCRVLGVRLDAAA